MKNDKKGKNRNSSSGLFISISFLLLSSLSSVRKYCRYVTCFAIILSQTFSFFITSSMRFLFRMTSGKMVFTRPGISIQERLINNGFFFYYFFFQAIRFYWTNHFLFILIVFTFPFFYFIFYATRENCFTELIFMNARRIVGVNEY